MSQSSSRGILNATMRKSAEKKRTVASRYDGRERAMIFSHTLSTRR